LDSGVCQRFWLTVRVPEEARAGLYQGQAVLRADNAPESRIELRLEVLPFRLLRDPAKSFGNYYYHPLDKIRPSMSEAVVAAIRRRAEAEARDMQEHGMTTLQMGGIGAKKVDGQWQAVINLDDRIEFLRRFGLWGQAPGVMMGVFFAGDIYRDVMGESWRKHLIGAKMPTQAYFDAITTIIAQVEKVRLERGWPDFYYYPIDEAAAEAVPILAKTLEAIKIDFHDLSRFPRDHAAALSEDLRLMSSRDLRSRKPWASASSSFIVRQEWLRVTFACKSSQTRSMALWSGQ
jgi:hypothetical protein